MDDGFDYMVTPLVFNLQLTVDAEGYDIEKVYGSPEADEATGEIMKVNTLFPSETVDGETKGGLVLLQLKKTSDNPTISLSASYENRSGETSTSTATVDFGDTSPESFDNTGIHKGVLLSRYVNVMKNWIVDEREDIADKPAVYDPYMTEDTGIMIPEPIDDTGTWERGSVDLQISEHYQDLFTIFRAYFAEQAEALNDETLDQEIELMDTLLGPTVVE